MAAVLLRLEMLSHGSCQAWNASGSHSGEPDDRIVVLTLCGDEPPHLRWRRIYLQATTTDRRIVIIRQAQDELESWTRRTAPRVENTKSLAELVIEDGKGYEPEAVARRFCISAAYVRRLRARAGHDMEDGRRLEPVDDTSAKPAKAVELRRRGMSTRQIAMILDSHQTQVIRWTRKSSATPL